MCNDVVMNDKSEKKRRLSRKISVDNYVDVLRYFSRPALKLHSKALILLRSYTEVHKPRFNLYYPLEYIESHTKTFMDLLAHHKENSADPSIIRRFTNHVENAHKRIPITQVLLDELQVKVNDLSAKEWQRCADSIRQKRKRELDKKTNTQKHTVKVSSPIFLQLAALKASMPNATWDEFFSDLISNQKPKTKPN